MRILLAEDETELCEALAIILKHSNYSVDTVYNGTDAEDYLMTGIYDAAILDIMMPGKDGIEVLRSIRAKGISTPVMILTAKSGIDDRVTGLDSGADDYLTKPFASKELLARLRAIIRRKTESVDNTLRFGNAILDPLTFELQTASGKEQLSNREFQMLQMLMMNPGNIISVERFYRPDEARNSAKGGHGIGLSVAKAIVDAHKGRITARSSDGKSFQITITL